MQESRLWPGQKKMIFEETFYSRLIGRIPPQEVGDQL
jgi:hypothetical protein